MYKMPGISPGISLIYAASGQGRSFSKVNLILSASIILAAVFWNVIVFRLSPKFGLVKPNFAQKPIMASYGIVEFGYIAALLSLIAGHGYAAWRIVGLYLVVMGAMWILGAIDDIFGNRDVGGFKGHFKKLLFERKLTTGALKALGGGIVGLAAALYISGGDWLRFLPAAMIIPLAANLLNILDLRPGRAVSIFFLGFGVIWILSRGRDIPLLVVGCIALVAAAFGIADSRGKAMMGDSGSNALGAALGLTFALYMGIGAQLATIALCIAIQLYSEKHSISKLIEGSRVLHSIDRRLGVR